MPTPMPTPSLVPVHEPPRRTQTNARRGTLVLLVAAVLGAVGFLSPAHAMPVDGYGTYQPQVTCDPNAKSGVVATRDLLRAKFGGSDLGIVRSCSVGGLSEHKEGRAWDWGLNARNAADAKTARNAIDWLTETVDGEPAARARQLGIMYMIWDREIWRAYSPSSGWQPYSGASPHTDHIHMSFTWNGATQRTSWWTGQVEPFDYGPCVRWSGESPKAWSKPRTSPCLTPLQRPRADKAGFYIAQRGERVRRVARFFDIPTRKVRKWNGYPVTGLHLIEAGTMVRVEKP
jgi:hypothetical protein